MKDGLAETPSIETYLLSHLDKGATVGIDGMVFSLTATNQMRSRFAAGGIGLNTCFAPIDSIWADRPALPGEAVFIHDEKYAGESAVSKIGKAWPMPPTRAPEPYSYRRSTK